MFSISVKCINPDPYKKQKKNQYILLLTKKKSEKKRDMPTIKYRHHQSANRSLQLREKSPDSRALCYATMAQ